MDSIDLALKALVTQWFDFAPSRKDCMPMTGVWEVELVPDDRQLFVRGARLFAHWNGTSWGLVNYSPAEAYHDRTLRTFCKVARFRGLADAPCNRAAALEQAKAKALADAIENSFRTSDRLARARLKDAIKTAFPEAK